MLCKKQRHLLLKHSESTFQKKHETNVDIQTMKG